MQQKTTADEIDLESASFFENPYPTYRTLRDQAPAYYLPSRNLWLVTRYRDVANALSDHATYSSAKGNTIIDTPTRVGRTLGSIDPPRHDELRTIVRRGFTVERLEAQIPAVRQHAVEALTALKENGGGDVVRDFSSPVLFAALGRMLGLDEPAARRAAELSVGLFDNREDPFGKALPEPRFAEIMAFLKTELDRRRGARGDDLFSVLINAQDGGAKLPDDVIVGNMSTVLLAGNASIGHFLPNLIHALWLHPDQRRSLQRNPEKWDAAIDESVRWDTSTQSFARQVTADVTIENKTIPADSRVVLFYASANRDERTIPEPDLFDIERKRTRHFGFGSGAHFCLGAQLTWRILKTIMPEFLSVLGDYELDTARAVRVRHVMVRGFRQLPVQC